MKYTEGSANKGNELEQNRLFQAQQEARELLEFDREFSEILQKLFPESGERRQGNVLAREYVNFYKN